LSSWTARIFGYTACSGGQTMGERRKAPTVAQRLMPCECCEQFALTQQHHLLSFAKYGEGQTVQLCGSCHDIVHVAQNVYNKPTPYNNTLWMNFIGHVGHDDKRVSYILKHITEVRDMEMEAWRQNLEDSPDDFAFEE
jgi:hypothetical protein